MTARRVGDSLELTVEDDGAGVEPAAEPPDGHGLENTRERLRTLYGDRASLVIGPAPEQGTIARHTIPYRETLLGAPRDAE